MYALADCNNFFVSCERVFRPDLEGKPVVVLSSNDGCAIARSNEAKKLGIKMGQPFYQFSDIVRRHNVVLFSCNFILYGDMSNRVRMTLAQFAPSIEAYSIDESFLKFEGVDSDLDGLAKMISRTCRRNTGIPVSVGVAPTKTLAKIAAQLCKDYPRLNGGCFMHRAEDIEKVLKRLPIGDVWGIGRKYAQKLLSIGVHTAFDFTQLPSAWVEKQLTVVGLRTWRELRGEPCIDFLDAPAACQQICVSRSFAKEIYDVDELAEQVSMFTAMAVGKLRKQFSASHSITLFINTNKHKEGVAQHMESKLITFQVATDSTMEINKTVLIALRGIFIKGNGYKKAGVILGEIVPNNQVQLSLFDTVDREKQSVLMQTIDNINNKEGQNIILLGSQSPDGFKTNKEHLSPQYTTRWSDIITVKL